MKKLVQTIAHHARVFHSKVREARKESSRSPKWSSVRDEHLTANPACEACGGTKNLQVHHKKPFSDFPELELDPKNLVTLCMGPLECHLRIGHGGSFRHYNPNLDEDILEVMLRPKHRVEIEARAKKARLDHPPE